jgi:hypothetical protein
VEDYMTEQKILQNMARCGKCKEVIESKHRHDWVQCPCKATYVDGGLDYLRRGFIEEHGYEELSTYRPEN